MKQLFNSESCLRVGLYGHFHTSVLPKQPAHLCCSICRNECKCNGDDCSADELPYKAVQNTQGIAQTPQATRTLNDTDLKDLRLSLKEIKEQYSIGMMSIFHEETSHGFSDKLIDDLVLHAKSIFSGTYLTENLAIYSSRHAIDILEIFQEIFGDIQHFEKEMDELHLINKTYSESESYLLAKSSDNIYEGDVVSSIIHLPEYDIDF